jgi:acyl-homoserine lactone synthase
MSIRLNMRIEVIQSSDRSARKALLRQAFALRHRVFVEERGWEFLRRPDGLDVDRYDGGVATHVLLLEHERVLGHVRLIPGGYLAVARAEPARVREAADAAEFYGLSRFCIAPWVSNSLTRRALNACLFTAALRNVIDRGTSVLLFETDPAMIFVLRVLGFSVQEVGEAAPIAGRFLQPIVVRLDASVLSALPLKIANWTQGPNVSVSNFSDALS